MQTIHQQFQIEYSYSIFFTQHLFSQKNQTFADFIKDFGEAGFQRKALVVMDEGLMLHYPTLSDEIRAYFENCVPAVELANNILVVPNGPCRSI